MRPAGGPAGGRKVLVLMGSDSDLQAMRPAIETLREFGIASEVRVLSVHRAPDLALEAAASARGAGFGAVICGAGAAAHLAGAVAAKTTLPVIGVPIESGALRGIDALYATVQMPPGVPVATVGIGGARNAALLAVEIFAVGDPGLAAALDRHKERLVETVRQKDREVQKRLAEGGDSR